MKILVFIPAFGREHITRLCFASIRRLMDNTPEGFELIPFVVVSDRENLQLSEEFGFLHAVVDNTPLGRKKNIGLQHAWAEIDFDYLMECDSDTLINPDLFAFYGPIIAQKVQYFGINRIGFLEYETGRFQVNQIRDEVWVTGRMISREYIERVLMAEDHLWTPEKNSALGWDQECRMNRVFGVPQGQCKAVTPINGELLFIDIKSGHNITAFDTLLNASGMLVSDGLKPVTLAPFLGQLPADYVEKYIGYEKA